jgi:MraZ protein
MLAVLLLGEYRLSLDDKGRLSVPAAIRHELRTPDDQTLVITKFFEHCLVIYPKPAWLERQQQLLELPNSPGARAFLRQLCASASICNLDRQGRILLSPKLRQYAAIDSEVLMIGMIWKLEVWAPERWETYESDESSGFDKHAFTEELRL